ncbi:hypothetical protein U3516DRAFT_829735 [Neocallimastix sp. 'constans']
MSKKITKAEIWEFLKGKKISLNNIEKCINNWYTYLESKELVEHKNLKEKNYKNSNIINESIKDTKLMNKRNKGIFYNDAFDITVNNSINNNNKYSRKKSSNKNKDNKSIKNNNKKDSSNNTKNNNNEGASSALDTQQLNLLNFFELNDNDEDANNLNSKKNISNDISNDDEEMIRNEQINNDKKYYSKNDVNIDISNSYLKSSSNVHYKLQSQNNIFPNRNSLNMNYKNSHRLKDIIINENTNGKHENIEKIRGAQKNLSNVRKFLKKFGLEDKQSNDETSNDESKSDDLNYKISDKIKDIVRIMKSNDEEPISKTNSEIINVDNYKLNVDKETNEKLKNDFDDIENKLNFAVDKIQQLNTDKMILNKLLYNRIKIAIDNSIDCILKALDNLNLLKKPDASTSDNESVNHELVKQMLLKVFHKESLIKNTSNNDLIISLSDNNEYIEYSFDANKLTENIGDDYDITKFINKKEIMHNIKDNNAALYTKNSNISQDSIKRNNYSNKNDDTLFDHYNDYDNNENEFKSFFSSSKRKFEHINNTNNDTELFKKRKSTSTLNRNNNELNDSFNNKKKDKDIKGKKAIEVIEIDSDSDLNSDLDLDVDMKSNLSLSDNSIYSEINSKINNQLQINKSGNEFLIPETPLIPINSQEEMLIEDRNDNIDHNGNENNNNKYNHLNEMTDRSSTVSYFSETDEPIVFSNPEVLKCLNDFRLNKIECTKLFKIILILFKYICNPKKNNFKEIPRSIAKKLHHCISNPIDFTNERINEFNSTKNYNILSDFLLKYKNVNNNDKDRDNLYNIYNIFTKDIIDQHFIYFGSPFLKSVIPFKNDIKIKEFSPYNFHPIYQFSNSYPGCDADIPHRYITHYIYDYSYKIFVCLLFDEENDEQFWKDLNTWYEKHSFVFKNKKIKISPETFYENINYILNIIASVYDLTIDYKDKLYTPLFSINNKDTKKDDKRLVYLFDDPINESILCYLFYENSNDPLFPKMKK